MINETETIPDTAEAGRLCLAAAEKYRKHRAVALYREGKVYGALSYRELGSRAARIAALLESLGLTGGTAFILTENQSGWAAAYFGVLLAGLTPLSLPVEEPSSRPAVLFLSEERLDEAARFDKNLPRIYLDRIVWEKSVVVSLYGTEKTIPLPAAKRCHAGRPVQREFPIKLYRRDRLLSNLCPGLCPPFCIEAPLSRGSQILLMDESVPAEEFFKAVQLLRPTVILLHAALAETINAEYRRLKAKGLYRLPLLGNLLAARKLVKYLGSSIRLLGIGGASPPPETEALLRRINIPFFRLQD